MGGCGWGGVRAALPAMMTLWGCMGRNAGAWHERERERKQEGKSKREQKRERERERETGPHTPFSKHVAD